MPRSAALILAGAALIAVGAFASRFVGPPPVPPPADGGVGALAESGVDAALDEAALAQLTRRLDRLEEKVFQPRLAPRDPSDLLASFDGRLRALEQRSAASTAPVPAAPPAGFVAAAKTTAVPTPDELRALSDDGLVVRARSLAKGQSFDLAEPFWREVVARGAADDVLVEANLGIGYALRGAKKHEDEAEFFHEAMRIAGADSERGQWANYQIAWSERFRDDYAAARDRMAQVASSRFTTRNMTGHANLYVARFSLELKDEARAREALERIVRDFGDSKVPMEAWLTEQATGLLKNLDG